MVVISDCNARRFLDSIPKLAPLVLACLLFFPESKAFSNVLVVDFPNSGNVKVKGGGTARIVGIEGYNPATGKYNAVLDGRDKLGNKIRVNRALKAVPAAVARYGRMCLSPTAAAYCIGAAAITATLAYEGYDIINGWFSSKGQDYGQCPSKYVPIVDETGKSVMTWVGMPCLKTSKLRYEYHTILDTPEIREWSNAVSGPTERRYTTWEDQQTVLKAPVYIFSRGRTTDDDLLPPVDDRPLTDEEFTSIIISDPQNLQIAPGLYPDIWEEITLDEISDSVGEGEAINPDPDFDSDDYIDMDEVPEQTINLSDYFTWGDGWLPKSCPAPLQVPLMGDVFEIKYDLICDMVSTYMSPLIKFSAVITFIAIVIGGGTRE